MNRDKPTFAEVERSIVWDFNGENGCTLDATQTATVLRALRRAIEHERYCWPSGGLDEGANVEEEAAAIRRAYAAFNARDVDGALSLMTEDVSWPKASEGGSVIGKAAIRDYWTRQWVEFDPHVEPVGISREANGNIDVAVRQVVKNSAGDILFDGEVRHVYEFADDGRIRCMTLRGEEAGTQPSEAFARRERAEP